MLPVLLIMEVVVPINGNFVKLSLPDFIFFSKNYLTNLYDSGDRKVSDEF